jgi:hypothetical protein
LNALRITDQGDWSFHSPNEYLARSCEEGAELNFSNAPAFALFTPEISQEVGRQAAASTPVALQYGHTFSIRGKDGD